MIYFYFICGEASKGTDIPATAICSLQLKLLKRKYVNMNFFGGGRDGEVTLVQTDHHQPLC